MLEELLGAVLRSQTVDLKRRTTGALLEGVALGMIGIGTVFLFLGVYVWLSEHMAAWLAALILSLVAFAASLVMMLVGRSLLHKKAHKERATISSDLAALEQLLKARSGGDPADREAAPGLVVAALAAGVVLGRSLKR